MSIRPVKTHHPVASPPSKAPASSCAAPSASATPAEFDPFLLLDDFRNDKPDDYLAGFPWHPHRGIETITYVLAGDGRARRQPRQPGRARRRRRAVDDRGQRHHAPGDAARRRAGPHARLPALGQPAARAEDDGAALPGRQGGRHPGGHRRRRHPGARRRAATSGARRARSTASPPIRATSTSRCRPASARRFRSRSTRHAFAYVFAGSGTFRDASEPLGVLTEKDDRRAERSCVREQTGNRSLVLFDRGDEVTVQAGEEGIRFLLVSGKPLEEPVAWYGPIVMNTQAELQQAVERAAQRHVHQAAVTDLVSRAQRNALACAADPEPGLL